MVQKTYTPLGLDGAMQRWVGKGTWGLGDMAQKTYNTFRVRHGGHTHLWRDGDMRRHTHLFRVRHGDMGFRGYGV